MPQAPDRPTPTLRGFLPLPEIEEQEEAVEVDGFRLLPLGDLGRAWEIHPKALAGLAWDSNPLLADSGSDADAVARLTLGLESRFIGRDGWQGGFGGDVRWQRYRQTAGRDFTAGDADARVERQGGSSRLLGLAEWVRTREPVADLPEQIRRQTTSLSLAASGEASASAWSLRSGWRRLDYLEDTANFERRSRDLQRWSLDAGWHLLGAAESQLGILSTAALGTHPAGSPANDYRSATLLGHWHHSLGGRSAADFRVGATCREHDGDSAGNPANHDRVLWAPAGSASLYWSWESHSHLAAIASTDLDEGMVATTNAARRDTLEARTRIRLHDRLDLLASAWRTWRIDSAPGVSGLRERTDDLYLRSGLDYRLREGLGLRLWAAWQRHAAEASPDYRRVMAALEVATAL